MTMGYSLVSTAGAEKHVNPVCMAHFSSRALVVPLFLLWPHVAVFLFIINRSLISLPLDGWEVLDHDMTTAPLATTGPHPMAWTVPMTDAPCTTEDTTAALLRATTRDTTATKPPFAPRISPPSTRHICTICSMKVFKKAISKRRRPSVNSLLRFFCSFSP